MMIDWIRFMFVPLAVNFGYGAKTWSTLTFSNRLRCMQLLSNAWDMITTSWLLPALFTLSAMLALFTLIAIIQKRSTRRNKSLARSLQLAIHSGRI